MATAALPVSFADVREAAARLRGHRPPGPRSSPPAP